jgi:hypothetical protein
LLMVRYRIYGRGSTKVVDMTPSPDTADKQVRGGGLIILVWQVSE